MWTKILELLMLLKSSALVLFLVGSFFIVLLCTYQYLRSHPIPKYWFKKRVSGASKESSSLLHSPILLRPRTYRVTHHSVGENRSTDKLVLYPESHSQQVAEPGS